MRDDGAMVWCWISSLIINERMCLSSVFACVKVGLVALVLRAVGREMTLQI